MLEREQFRERLIDRADIHARRFGNLFPAQGLRALQRFPDEQLILRQKIFGLILFRERDGRDVRVTVNGKQILVTMSLKDIEPELGRAVLEKMQIFLDELRSYTPPPKPPPAAPKKSEDGPCTAEDLQSLRDF